MVVSHARVVAQNRLCSFTWKLFKLFDTSDFFYCTYMWKCFFSYPDGNETFHVTHALHTFIFSIRLHPNNTQWKTEIIVVSWKMSQFSCNLEWKIIGDASFYCDILVYAAIKLCGYEWIIKSNTLGYQKIGRIGPDTLEIKYYLHF